MRAFLFAALVAGCAAQVHNCSVDPDSRFDCKKGSQQDCESVGCCWNPVDPNPNNDPWCYYKSGITPAPPPPCPVNLTASGYGFTADFYNSMQTNFLQQINVQQVGAVVAAPDKNTPGGSYYYHWMRDGALSMWAYLKINNMSYDKVQTHMEAYQGWVQKVQNEADPNSQSVLTEPKFMIPDASVYSGGWCRPQTDGPALRANTMVHWAQILIKAGQQDKAQAVWTIIKTDLAWVVANWQSNGCDLWEEVRSNNFFWNRMGFVNSLNTAAALATTFGDSATATTYTTTAATIKATLSTHWNGKYLFESNNREIDGAVIHAVASFGGDDADYGPLADKVASTLETYLPTFCRQFDINQKDTAAGIPGVMFGRYPGDSYAGGNPWQLLTAILANLYYKTAQSVKNLEKTRGGEFTLAAEEYPIWKRHLKLKKTATSSEFAAAAVSAGDAVMTRLYSHVKGDGGRVDEQIDRNTGAQASAQSLTWSYANILETLTLRFTLN